MNAKLNRSYSRQLRNSKIIEPIKCSNERTIKKSRSNANIMNQTTSMNVYTKKTMNDIDRISKQSKAKIRNRYQTDYESEYNKQFSKPRNIPQIVKNQYITHHIVDTNRILFPDDEYDNDNTIFTSYHKGKKKYQLSSSGSITELFSKENEPKKRRKISGKLNEETGIFSAEFRKLTFKREKKTVDLVKVKSDNHYAGNFNSVYDLWHKLSIKTRNKQENSKLTNYRELNARYILKYNYHSNSDYAKMIKMKSRESDLFGTHTAIPRNPQGKHCNYFNRSVVF